ncbi:MAG: amidohydrolase family protein [Acidimicrobiales bacterium]
MINPDDLADGTFTVGGRRTGSVTFLPEPERHRRRYTIISVDDHIVEPPDLFEGRLPSKLVRRSPKVVELDDGTQLWEFEGKRYPNIGFNAVVGRPIIEASFEPTRFDEMRRGSWDVHARIADMDIDGVFASLNFPSALLGFAGQRLQRETADPELALAVVRANNDWHIEEWAGQYPERIIPCQVPYYLDPEIGAAEIRSNAARGFKAVTFSEAPEKLGLPSLHTGYWDPILAACEETDTAVCLHIGSASSLPATAPDAPPDTIGVLAFGFAMFSAVDWLYSLVPVRYPKIKIVMSEGGLAWVPGLIDRLNHVLKYHDMYGTWTGIDLTPAEVFQRNFWHCALDDPSTMKLRAHVGVEHILMEADYPHLDSSWPNTQDVIGEQVQTLDQDEIRKVTWENAARLFRHPVPAAVADDPDSY